MAQLAPYMPNSYCKSLSSADDVSPNSINPDEILEVVKKIAKLDDFKVNLKYSGASTAITGAGGVIGGTALTPFGLTPVGIIVGTMVGSLTSFALFRDKYISLVEIINNLPEDEIQLFISIFVQGFKQISVVDTKRLLELFNKKDELLVKLVKVILNQVKIHFEKNGKDATLVHAAVTIVDNLSGYFFLQSINNS